MTLDAEIIEPSARNAAPAGASEASGASPLRSTKTASNGTVGTVLGQEGPSTARLTDAAAAWVQTERKIGRATLERLNVGSGTTWFPDADARLPAIFFRYAEGWKARAFPEKHFVAGKGFKLAFWNLERVLAASPATVFIAEGEFDAVALAEAGISIDSLLSVPNGAKDRPSENVQEAKGLDYVREALAAGLNRVKRFIWCGDNDGPGLALRHDMARLFGAARFYFVTWPEGCKDANDVLKCEGPEFLRELVTEGALPWPVAGLYRLSELPEPPPMTLWDPGFPAWNHGQTRLMFAPRTMSVVTGHPGHGKTLCLAQIWFQIAHRYQVPICVASFETRPKPHMRRQLRTLYCDSLEKYLGVEEARRADAWIDERYIFLVHPEQRPTLEWFLDMAEVAVVRHGCRVVQVDPWNRLEASRAPGETETDYIGRCLRTIHGFAHDLNCHVQVIAHPAKMDSARRGQPPALEDLAGSKHWDNMVDQGIVVHRPVMFEGNIRKTEAVVLHRKARFEELGHPCKLELNYSVERGRYETAVDADESISRRPLYVDD